VALFAKRVRRGQPRDVAPRLARRSHVVGTHRRRRLRHPGTSGRAKGVRRRTLEGRRPARTGGGGPGTDPENPFRPSVVDQPNSLVLRVIPSGDSPSCRRVGQLGHT